ncbi:MAG TPA: PHP domain-containing protein, partial [Erysipelothrix sp.]|nr:PHP domain-containing protein [Erysipelothrix sp.]
MLVHDFLKKLQIPKKYLGLFPNIEMDELTYRRRQKRLYWTLKTSKILSFELYQQLQQAILDHFHVALHLSVQPENPQATHVLVSDYLLFFYDQLGVSNRLRSSSLVLEGDLLSIVMLTKEDVDTMRTYQFDLQERLSVVGFELMVDFVLYQQLDNEEPKAKISAKPLFGSSHQPSANNGRSRQRGEPVMVELKHLVEDMNNIKTKGELFKLNLRQLKSGTYIANFMIHSGDDAIECTKFYKTEADCLLKENTTYLVTGDYQYNSYARNHQLKTRDIEEIAPLFTIEDRDPIKRVELHAHSNFSEMDAVSSVESLIQQAYDFGHPGLAITDHMVVHAFPKAQRYVEKLL